MTKFKAYWPFNLIEASESITLAKFDLPANICPDHNFKLSTGDGCAVEPDVSDIIFKGSWDPVTYEKTKEVEEDGFGGQITTLKRVGKNYKLRTYADEAMVRYLYEMAYTAQELKLIDIAQNPAAPDKIIRDVEIEDSEVAKDLYEVIISYKTDLVQHDAVGLAGCCKQLYEEAPYEDECGDNGGGSNGSEEPLCSDLNIAITKSGDDLAANVSGNQGSYQINWLYRENENSPWQTLIENASVIQIGDPGIYRAVLLAPGCPQQFDQYLFLGNCYGISVQLEQNANALVATPAGACPNGTFKFYLFNDQSEEFDLQMHDGSPVFLPSEDGLYKVVYVCDDCEVENIALFSGIEECPILLISIQKDEGELIVIGAEEALDPIYKWYKDSGEGLQELTGETESTLQVSGNGLYKVVLTESGCHYEATILILNPPICDPCDSIATGITYEGNVLTAHVVGCEETNISWFVNNGSGYTQVGSGATHSPGTLGLYRAKINCGDCTKYSYYLVCEEGEGEIGNFDVLEYSEFVDSGDTLQLPHIADDVLLVFKDNLMLKKDAGFLGWSWETDIVTLSENVSTNNPAGGETITVLYKISL